MKALFLNGSARGNKGITAKLIHALADGMVKAGMDTSLINICDLSISPCKACLHCMHKNPGICIQNDGMEIIYNELKHSDCVIFGTPVYLDGLTAQLKVVIDRLVCCMEPFLVTDDAGYTRHSFSWRLPKEFIVVSTCGFPESETFKPVIDYFRALSGNMNSRVLAEFCVPGSIAIQMKPEILDPKLELLESAGYEYGRSGVIDDNLIEKVNRPLFNKEEYFELARLYENWCRKKLNNNSRGSI